MTMCVINAPIPRLRLGFRRILLSVFQEGYMHGHPLGVYALIFDF